MAVSVVNEAYVFLAMVVLGVAGGLLFDCFRILRRVVNMKTVAVSLSDVLFWILAVVLIFGGIFKINSGQLRWYELIGLALGLVIYFCAFSRWVIEICVKLVGLCVKFFGRIFKIVLTPLTFLYKILSKPFYWISRRVKQAFGSLKKRFYLTHRRGKPERQGRR
jgi:spore cortex biosynthesis protein YabQ